MGREDTIQSNNKTGSSLAVRFAVAIPLGLAGICALAYGDKSLLVFICIVGLLCLREYWRMAGISEAGKPWSMGWIGDIAAVLLILSFYFEKTRYIPIGASVFIMVLLIHQFFSVAYGGQKFFYPATAVFFGAFYIGGSFGALMLIRGMETDLVNSGNLEFSSAFFTTPGMHHLTLYPFLASFGTDTTAFFSGKFFGNRKLAPVISPNKSVIGLMGGMVGSAFIITFFSYLNGLVNIVPVWQLIVFGIVAAVISQLGDLSVSALKREAKMKDSGRLLLAHGGMLDRVDGFLFAIPATYLFFLLVL